MARARPGLHGGGVGAEQVRDLFQGEQAPPAQATVAVFQAVSAPQDVNDLQAEPFGHAGVEARRVQDVDDLGIGVVLE